MFNRLSYSPTLPKLVVSVNEYDFIKLRVWEKGSMEREGVECILLLRILFCLLRLFVCFFG